MKKKKDFSLLKIIVLTGINFSVDLPKGVNKIETWFLDKDNNPLCSAYYTNTEKIN